MMSAHTPDATVFPRLGIPVTGVIIVIVVLAAMVALVILGHPTGAALTAVGGAGFLGIEMVTRLAGVFSRPRSI
jgi:hypothetical protein